MWASHEDRGNSARVCVTDAEVFDIFTLPMVVGDPKTGLSKPHTAFLSQTLARKLFGNQDPIGQTVNIDYKWFKGDFTVTGILKNQPKTSNDKLRFDFLTTTYPHPSSRYPANQWRRRVWEEWPSDWFIGPLRTYVLVRPDADVAELQKKLHAFAADHQTVGDERYDLVLAVVTRNGQKWTSTTAIPVFFSPLTDEKNTTVMEGVDTQLRAITVPFGRGKGPSVYLLVKADENSPMIDSNKNAIRVSMTPSVNGLWSSIFKSFNSIGLVSAAYAHDHHVSHGPHYGRIQPAREITIFEPHEDETKLDIKIDVRIRIKDVPGNNDWIHKQSFDLRDVDEINIPYQNYKNLTTQHGTAARPNGYTIYWIRVYETDFWNADDEVCRWSEVYIRNSGSLYLPRHQGDRGIGEEGQGLHQDAETTIRKIAN